MTRHLLTRRRLVAAGLLLAAGTPAWAQAAPLRIGFQKGSINLVLLKSLGLLDKHLPGVAVSWIEFPAGPQLLEDRPLAACQQQGSGAAIRRLLRPGPGLIPQRVRVADIVWQPGGATLAAR